MFSLRVTYRDFVSAAHSGFPLNRSAGMARDDVATSRALAFRRPSQTIATEALPPGSFRHRLPFSIATRRKTIGDPVRGADNEEYLEYRA